MSDTPSQENAIVTIDSLPLWTNAVKTASGALKDKFIPKKAYIEKFMANPENAGKSKADAIRAHFIEKGNHGVNRNATISAAIAKGQILATDMTLLKSGDMSVKFTNIKNMVEPGAAKAKAPKAKTLEEQAAALANLPGSTKSAVEILAFLRAVPSNPANEAAATADEIKSEAVNA